MEDQPFLIRDIDTAGRLYDRASVTRAALRALLWGSGIFFLSGFAWAAFGPGENLPLADWPKALAEPVLITSLLLVCTFAANYGTGWLSRIIAACILVVALLWCVEPVLQARMTAGFGPLWLATAAVRIPIVIWVSLEIALGAVALITAKNIDLKTTTEAGGIAAFIGAPPALRYLAKDRRWTSCLFLVTAFLFGLAVMQLVQLNTSAAISAENARVTCSQLGNAERAACFERIGLGDVIGQLVVWPLTFIMAVVAARTVRQWARVRLITSATHAMERDPRCPILFLRWFGNDHGQLNEAEATPMRWLLASTASEPAIDKMLIETYSAYGPTIALGNPDDHPRRATQAERVPLRKKPDLTVWRDFPPDTDWQKYLHALAEKAAAIVMMVELAPDAHAQLMLTPGVAHELSLLSPPELRSKTLFLLGGKTPKDATLANRIWSTVHERSGLPLPQSSASSPHPLAAFTLPGGTIAVATSSRFTRNDYAMALRWFFETRFAADPDRLPKTAS